MTKTGEFSVAKTTKNLAHHPDLTPEDYAALPELGSRPDYVIQDGPHTLVLVQMTPQRWAAVKATESGQGLFVTSFRRTNEKNLELLLKKGKLLGGEE